MNEPYDKNYVLAHLKLYETHAKKNFGQNFLISAKVVEHIVDALSLTSLDECLEIGPGLGALTYALTQRVENLTLVEIDKTLYEHLKTKYPKATIYNMDFLKYDFKRNDQPIKVVGNLPYGLTSEIIEKLIFNNEKISSAVLMIQKEAYERFISKKDSKEYGPLSIFIEYLGGTTLIEKVSRHSYYPEPNVDSVVFKMDFKKSMSCRDEKNFFKVVKNMFLMRRKTILNNLGNYLKDKELAMKKLSELNINFSTRPENLSLNDYIRLSEALL